jgi:epoxide hydrolase-like predicted phosphatase
MVASTSDGVKRPLRAVIFDYGGVLRADGREVWAAADAAAGLPADTLWKAWHDIPEYRVAREGRIDGDAFRAAIHRALVAATGSVARADTALTMLEAHLAGLPPVDADMRALVERLRATGRVKLGMLSNANRGWTERFRGRGIASLFDDVVVSGDVGLAKPDPAVFRLAADRLQLPPDTCLMIDDQPQHVAGAQAAGMRAHLLEAGDLAELVARLEAEGALTAYALVIEDAPRADDVTALSDGLSAHALPHTGVPGFKPLAAWLRDEQGALIGGAYGYVNWNWLFINLVWLPDTTRGHGHGRRVIRALEEAARERGCTHAHLDTFSFQARGFYERLGYEVFSILEDYPRGHRRFFMKKVLDG